MYSNGYFLCLKDLGVQINTYEPMIDYIARFNGSVLTPVHRWPKLNSNGLEIWAIKVASSHDISKWSIILKRIAVRSSKYVQFVYFHFASADCSSSTYLVICGVSWWELVRYQYRSTHVYKKATYVCVKFQ